MIFLLTKGVTPRKRGVGYAVVALYYLLFCQDLCFNKMGWGDELWLLIVFRVMYLLL